QLQVILAPNIIHHRVHVDDDHVLLVPNCGAEGHETAVPALDGGRREREWLASWHLRQHDHHILQTTVRRDGELIQQPPAGARRDAPAIHRVRKRDQGEPFRDRFPPGHRHLAGDRPSVGDGDFLIGPGRRGQDKNQDARDDEYGFHPPPPTIPIKKKGEPRQLPHPQIPVFAGRGRVYFEATGMTVAASGCWASAFFTPATAPDTGSSR